VSPADETKAAIVDNIRAVTDAVSSRLTPAVEEQLSSMQTTAIDPALSVRATL
jgi:hypothetical protein